MTNKVNKSPKTISREKILLAIIPVLGSIIVAIFGLFGNFSWHVDTNNDTNKEQIISVLREKSGKVNDMVVYNRYDDLSKIMIDGLKPIVTREKFNSITDSFKRSLGEFVKPIDTTFSPAYNNYNFTIKNQYQRGVNMNLFIFDGDGNLIGFYTNEYPR